MRSPAPIHFGPHPVIPRFDCPVPAEQVDRIRRLAVEILADDPRLSDTGVFGARVHSGLADVPSLHIHTVDRRFQGGSPVLREHRGLFLAREGDLVVLGEPCDDFVAYCREDLRLGRIGVLVPRPGRHTRRLGLAVLQDPTLCHRVAQVARRAGGLNVIPYQATGGLWALAGRISELSETPVGVGGPPPRLADAVNNKVWFSRQVGRLLGEWALPPTTSASSWALLAERVRRLARIHPRVGIKLPSAAGSVGNLVLDSDELLRFTSLAELRDHLLGLFAEMGWIDPFPTLVSVWEDSVLLSPSLQGWIPHLEEGRPILEGVFDQNVTGRVGRFVGSAPTRLSREVQELIAAQGARILLLFQMLGWYGRCSLDTILVGDDPATARLHWVECNGRWGGTSIPMTLVNRLVGYWQEHPFVTAGNLLAGSDRRFDELHRAARSRLFDRDERRGIVFLSPGPGETRNGFAALSIGRSLPAARRGMRGMLRELGA